VLAAAASVAATLSVILGADPIVAGGVRETPLRDYSLGPRGDHGSLGVGDTGSSSNLEESPSLDLPPTIPDAALQPLDSQPSTSEPTIKGTGGGSGGGRDPPGFRIPIYVAYCLYRLAETQSASCSETSPDGLANELAKLWEKKLINHAIKDQIKIRFPDYLSEYEQLRNLEKIEKRTIQEVAVWLRYEVAKLSPYEWRVENNRNIDAWVSRANRGAESNSDWRNDWSVNSHTFELGPTYDAGVGISIGKRGFE
jgi:hypothetical protein